VILFGTRLSGGIVRVSAAGGAAVPVTRIDPARQEVAHVGPSFLPDGRHFVYMRNSSAPEYQGTYVGSLDAKPDQQDVKRLVAAQTFPVYAATTDSKRGHLLFLRQNILMAQPFDAGRMELAGDAVAITEMVGAVNVVYGLFSSSQNGVLVYRSGGGSGSRMNWYDRAGKIIDSATEVGLYNSVRISPDGVRAAISRVNPLQLRIDKSNRGCGTGRRRYQRHQGGSGAPKVLVREIDDDRRGWSHHEWW
jgi:eukaryotic-like serine/threonine-protein kinase